ncbi:MAG: putative ABC transporter permease [Lachnospiraceae bacterium]|nr:putative ABC transporter permease [Lachnospiraceae bacterium]
MTEKNPLIVTKYMLMFLLASFIGWLYEIGCVYVMYKTYYDRGVLHIPCCPIYGFGMLILYFLFRKVKNPLIVFTGSVVITTTVEYIAAIVLEYRFHRILWTYRDWPLQFQGRVSAISSCLFGIMALLFMKLIVPGLNRIYASKVKNAVSAAVIILFLWIIAWEVHFTA